MWIWIANKSAKFLKKRLNRSENIRKSFKGDTFLKHPVLSEIFIEINYTFTKFC